MSKEADRARAYRAANPEKIKEAAIIFRAKHKKKLAEKNRAYRLSHMKETAERTRRYRARHPEKARAAAKKWADNHPEMRAKSCRRWRLANKEWGIEYSKRWKSEHPDRVKAHQVLNNSIALGKFSRQSVCEFCGSKTNIDGHHPDYSKPLEVIWLCGSCHQKLHLGIIVNALI